MLLLPAVICGCMWAVVYHDGLLRVLGVRVRGVCLMAGQVVGAFTHIEGSWGVVLGPHVGSRVGPAGLCVYECNAHRRFGLWVCVYVADMGVINNGVILLISTLVNRRPQVTSEPSQIVQIQIVYVLTTA